MALLFMTSSRLVKVIWNDAETNEVCVREMFEWMGTYFRKLSQEKLPLSALKAHDPCSSYSQG